MITQETGRADPAKSLPFDEAAFLGDYLQSSQGSQAAVVAGQDSHGSQAAAFALFCCCNLAPACAVSATPITASGRSSHLVVLVMVLFTSFQVLFSKLPEAEQTTPVLAQLESLSDALGVSPELPVDGERVGKVIEERVHHARVLRFQRVVNPLALTPGGKDAGLANGLKVSGKRGQAQFHRVGQLAYAQFVFTQRGDDANARRVSESFRQEDKIIHQQFVISGNDELSSQHA